jgi:TRAP-type C4-dicarboxylate transport system permease small subunit
LKLPVPASTGAASTGPLRWLNQFEALLGSLVQLGAGGLVLACMVVLFSGVFSRYVLHDSLAWSDELASILFLWLAMLGSVLALRRGEHMRMTAWVNRATPERKAFYEALGVTACLAYLAMVAMPALNFAQDEVAVTTPALEISNAWRAAALPIGMGLMALFGLFRLLRDSSLKQAALAVVLMAALVAAFWFASPWLMHLGKLNLLVFFVGVAGACVFTGIPIAFAFGLATVGYLGLSTSMPLSVVIGRMDEGMSHMILLAVPLFIFLAS